MGKGRRNQRNPDYYKVAGSAVEDRDIARGNKQAIAGQLAKRRGRAGGKTKLGEAPPEQHRAESFPEVTHPQAPVSVPAEVPERPAHPTLEHATSLVERGAERIGAPRVRRAVRQVSTWTGKAIDLVQAARAAIERARSND